MPEALTAAELEFLVGVFDRARAGDAVRLTEALDAGVPVNLTNSAGDTLLILAAYYTHLPVVRLLLGRGADTERVNDRGQTALGAAVFRRSAPIAEALLRAGADPDAGERSARQVAEFFGLTEMTILLEANSRLADTS
jgi:ankyrin repeat protein